MHLKFFIVVAQGKRREGEEEEGGLEIITWDLRVAGPALSYFQR